ncbi:MAG TPA: sterol desaturase family protein [Thermoanaerobaculia bacterium]|nr:sterol desaturase family protein [Thermoanaerobaculia bacterium]
MDAIETLRTVCFLAGLFTLLSWELALPHHSPGAPRLRRWFENLALAAVNGGVLALVCYACLAIAAQRSAPWRFGPFETLGLPLAVRLLGEILVLDLLAYGLHRAYHAVPALWRFHRVHHSDVELDVTSASRFHLGEVAVSGAAKLGTVALLGISPLGLIAFEIVMLLCAQFQHANVRIAPLAERALWWSFVPPAMHRIHHHPVRADTDSNYGTILTLWDRALGTLRRREGLEPRFGIEGEVSAPPRGVLRLLGYPFR